MKPKKKNPCVNLRESDIRRIKKEITDDAVSSAFAIFLMVMRDKWGFGHKRLNRLLESENGASVKASNFICEGKAGLTKQTGARQQRYAVAPKEYKQRYAVYLAQ